MKEEDSGVKRPTGSCFGSAWNDKFEAGGFTFFRRAFPRRETVMSDTRPFARQHIEQSKESTGFAN